MDNKSFVFRFDDVEVREREFTLIKAGEVLAIEPKAFRVLLFLLRNPQRLISKEELLNSLWGDAAVTEGSLTRCIWLLRRRLEDDVREPRYIETVATVGYRFICRVETLEEPGANSKETEDARGFSLNDGAKSRRALRFVFPAILAAFLLILITIGWKALLPPPREELRETQLTANSSDNPINGAAISGDGKYLAYGDDFGLHLRSLESGETRDIPNPKEIGDAHALWSIRWFPDSTRFLAVSHPPDVSHPITWQASVIGGTLHKFRDNAEAWSVSPDGSTVAVTVPDQPGLLLVDASGENAREVLTGDKENLIQNVQWSPDGSRLLYRRIRPGIGAISSLEIDDLKNARQFTLLSDPRLGEDLYWLRDGRILYVKANPGFAMMGETCDYWETRIDERTNALASKPSQLTHNRGFCIGETSATADSKRLVFTKGSYESGVSVADIEAGGNRITPPRNLTMTEGVEFPNGWTADSQEVVLTSNRSKKWGIYRQPLGGGPAQPILLAKTQGPEPDFEWGFPRPSADGGWLLIEHYSPNTDRRDLYLVPMAGGKEELIAQDISQLPSCATPSIGLCAYSKTEKNQLIFWSFDPQLKQQRELGRFTLNPSSKVEYGWQLSPDATRIAVREAGTNNIYLLDLMTQTLRHIFVKQWGNLASMDWAADGKGLFMFSNQRGGVLLHVDLRGNAKVLWEPHQYGWAIPSPDGKHVAIRLNVPHTNVWMLENF